MSASDVAEQTLAAGGLVPANAKLGKSSTAVDTVVARAYQHAVLPGRTVIRLCAESVTAGDDLEMATLGFAPGETRGAVGKERKRPLGFPGWALVHDPKNARHALDVVKELKKHARKAKSKPGHAKEGFDAIATKLGKTVPHFLPSYYEEVGRVFVEHGALTYAASMFGKARETEAVHALEVDEQHRADAFLEFSLAGAVTTKALSEYAKQLGEGGDPKAAYAQFRQLCIQRTLGGMPPWSGMAKDLGRLAKAAKLDVAAEDASVIAEIIESPALAKAAGEFWRAYAEPITALGKQSAAARGALLNLFPTGSSSASTGELDDLWLDLLEASGAVAGLIGEVEEAARPAGSRAAWLDKLTVHLGRSWRQTSKARHRVFGLLRRMAPALIADGIPIKGTGRWNRLDLDLVELALELGVAVKPDEQASADTDAWATQVNEPEHGRDPIRAAAHPDVGPKIVAAVAGAIGNEPFDSASRGKQGFLAAKRTWIETAMAAAERAGLPSFEAVLQMIANKVTAGTFAELPDLHARFAALDVAPALARTLQIGLIDEFGWPALEEAAHELDPEGKGGLSFHGAPVAVVLANATRVIAVGASGRLGVHDLVIPPKHELCTARFIGNDFLIVLSQGYQVSCYWASSPKDVWKPENASAYSIPKAVANAVVLPDGAWLESVTPMRKGDRTLHLGARLTAHDGTTGWVNEWKDGKYAWREVSPTGELGRASRPAWIEAAIEGDWQLDQASHYFPSPTPTSPLGVSNGFTGARIRWRGGTVHKPEHHELETVDGRTLAMPKHLNVTDLLILPDGGSRALSHEHQYSKGTSLRIHDATAEALGSKLGAGDNRYCHGSPVAVTASFLHQFTARDVAGSKRLRAITVDDARALLAAAPLLDETTPMPRDLAGVLPEVTHAGLRAGITGVTCVAKYCQGRRDKLVDERAPGKAVAVASSGPEDSDILEALGGWTKRQWSQGKGGWAQIEQIGALLLDGDRRDRTVKGLPATALDWFELAVVPWSLVPIALAIGTTPKHRAIIAQLFAHLTSKLPPAGKLRSVYGNCALPGETDAHTEPQVRWVDGNVYAIRQWGYSGENYHVLEYAPTGELKTLPKFAIHGELRGVAGTTDAAELAAAVAEGKTSWSPERAAQLAAATGMTSSEAVYLWAGCPNMNDRGNNFLDKELRETLDLKAAQAALARDAITALPLEKLVAIAGEVGRNGIQPLLAGTAVDVMASAWKQAFGARLTIPEAVLAEADEVDLRHPAAQLAMIAGGAASPDLTTDGFNGFDELGNLRSVSSLEPLIGQTAVEAKHAFSAGTLGTLVSYLPFMYAAMPAGDPLRATAPVAWELALARLDHPGLWLNGGGTWLANEAENFDRTLAGIGGALVPGMVEGRSLRRIPGGAVMRQASQAVLMIRPSELGRDRTAIDALSKQLNSINSTLDQIDYLRGADLRAMMERIRDTPVPAGGWEQNPLASAPKLVAKVEKKLGVSTEAAALYLQYLVLLWPIQKVILAYNGWKPGVLKSALDELVDKELLLEAKRERAGRGHFLPGGWEALKSPHPPLETWKLPYYGKRLPSGQIWGTFGRLQALAPFHLLFERAWKRIEDGDQPRYEEVQRGK